MFLVLTKIYFRKILIALITAIIITPTSPPQESVAGLSFAWTGSDFTATVTAEKDIDMTCVLPDGTKKQVILAAGESETLRSQL